MAAAENFIAIAGNPNSGKTTAFNRYTGARQHVGNYPGITVEKKEGTAHLGKRIVTLVDLPGTYSLTAYSLEEVVARRVLAEDRPGAVLDVVNAAVLERNLYLTVQMLEMGMPVVLALNMMDEARNQGIEIDTARLEQLTGIKAVPTVARQGEGLQEALAAALELADAKRGRGTPLAISYGPDIDQALKEMTPLVEKAELLTDKYPARWVALKFLERDDDIMSQARALAPETCEMLTTLVDKVATHIKTTLNSYPEALIADYRYGWISSMLRQGVLKSPNELRDRIAYSDKIDKVLTNRYFGPIIMFAVLYAMYFLVIEIGDYPLGWVETAFEWLDGVVGDMMSEGLLKSMITSGIIAGVGGVLGFVPLILIMFLLISVLEDSGYMARVAYMLDRVFRFFGLHGASIMPFIISGGIAGGCAVPGVMATRTLRSPKERLATMLTAPFMACGAKLPVFLLFVSIFFESHKALVMFLLTLAGWVAALLVARLLRSTLIKGAATPFVMELPPYRMPTLSGVLIHTWERTWEYIKKAGTIILAISILLWAAMTFPELPEELSATFAERKAPIAEKLEAYPSAKLSAAISELEEELAGLNADTARAIEINRELDGLRMELESLPVGRLQAEVDELIEQFEALPKDPVAEDLAEKVASYGEALEKLGQESEAGQTLKRQLDELGARYAATPSGAVALLLEAKQAELDALPEKQLEAQIAAIDNEEAALALRMSYGGRLGTALEPLTAPAGFDWRTNIALVGGIAAKEVVISTLGTAYSLGEVDEEDSSLANSIRSDAGWTNANAVALLLFTLLYSPCFVTLAVIKKESGQWRWLAFSLVFNLLLAYGVAVAANQILLLV
ncbi:ferrous iron transport protein B [Desulfovibrio sp. OttesenSCG-928-F20]|nr:ferrous iron transport protein B [Desulfovibrio sp. OttesenSCG-928-M16]MDL2291109.1 ferrous iron transport protein B [Desulfovibrio sp. OttesenSCG-928-F20]